jgi:hypothetical protein
MKLLEIQPSRRAVPLSRRGLFAMLPGAAAGCAGCVSAVSFAAQIQASTTAPGWTKRTDLTWEQMFRFAYQKDLIPLLKALAERLGREKFTRMLKEAGDAVVRKKTAGRPPMVKDLVTFAANMKNVPPLIQHTLEAQITEETPQAFEYRVTKCLWAKVFREEDAGDIGYAMICYPDYAVAKSLNPKLKLIRTQTLMQGDDCCRLRYVM